MNSNPKRERRIPLPLYTGGYSGDSSVLSSFTCVNLYPEKITGEPDVEIALIGTPGTLSITSLINNGQHRTGGACVHENDAYFVVGTKFIKYTSAGVASTEGTLNTDGTAISMSSNGVTGGQLTILDGTDGWIWNGTSFTQITDPQFPANPTKTCFIDGYTVVLSQDSDTFYLSDFYDSSSYTSAQTARAERNPDGLVNCTAYNRQLWLFGENTTEVWYNSGNTVPFDPVPNGFFQYGLAAADSLVNLEDAGLVFISKDSKGKGIPVHILGMQSKEIASPQLLSIWKDYTIEDAVAFGYQENGHVFYQVTFPTEGKTWVCDVTMNYAWHERRTGQTGRHIAQNYVYFNDMHIVGAYNSGEIFELDLDTYTDNGDEIIREFTTYHITNLREKVRHIYLELELETGVGLVSGQGSDPQIWLHFSDNLGRTYGNKRYKTLGTGGSYRTQIRWPMLGSSRNRVYKIGISDPVKIRIARAILKTDLTEN